MKTTAEQAGDTARPGEAPVTVTAAVGGAPGGSWEPLRKLPPEVRCVEVRADLTGDVDSRPLRDRFAGDLLYTLRSTAEGGACDAPADRRRERLIAAADDFPLVDLEADRDLHPALLERIPPERRVLSWHGPATDVAGLRRRFDHLASVGARLYRLAPAADSPAQALVPLRLLKSLGRRDVVAYARGPAGSWTRVLAARFGAPVVPGWLEGCGAAADAHARRGGELSVRALLAGYPPHLISRAERVYGIIGTSTGASAAPAVNNSGYQSLGLPALYLAFDTDELPRSLGELRAGLDGLGLPLGGATVVAPHKEAALALADAATRLARRAGAASLLRRVDSGWQADNEAAGVLATLAGNGIEVAGRRVAVIGCGGAGRAAAAGLTQGGALVTLVNRGTAGGVRAAQRLHQPFVRLGEFDPRGYAVLVHATPVRDGVPFPVDRADPAAVVFDLNYGGTDTPLTAAARADGRPTLDGGDLARVELPRQFHLMTGHHLSDEVALAALRRSRRGPDQGR